MILIVFILIQGEAFFKGVWLHAAKKPEITVYTYDSLVAKDGFGHELFSEFKKKYNCDVRTIAVGDGIQLISKLQLEAMRGNLKADIALGLDYSFYSRAKSLFDPSILKSQALLAQLNQLNDDIKKSVDLTSGFIPFDYGYLTFIADLLEMKRLGISPPTSLKDLLHHSWKGRILLEDPKTSSPGLGFVLFSSAILGSEAPPFWKAIRSQLLTLVPGWDAAYQLFLKSEAPIVWSYLTSQAYHDEQDIQEQRKKTLPLNIISLKRFVAINLEEGLPIQIEGVAILKKEMSEAQRDLTVKFIEFLLTPEMQSRIPKKNWMIPVLRNVQLPESFRTLPAPKKIIPLPSNEKAIHETLQEWTRSISR